MSLWEFLHSSDHILFPLLKRGGKKYRSDERTGEWERENDKKRGNSVAIDKEVGKGFLSETGICHSLWMIDVHMKWKDVRVNKAQGPKEKC